MLVIASKYLERCLRCEAAGADGVDPDEAADLGKGRGAAFAPHALQAEHEEVVCAEEPEPPV